MTMLAELVDGVIDVDTHRDTIAAAAVSPIGAVRAATDAPANARGYRRLLDFARMHIPGRRCWALEGIGSYGAGLATFLDQAGERVVEVCGPKRPAVRGGRKTDLIDAIRAAKEALTSEHLIQPRLRGEREALRVLLATRHGAVLASATAINQLKVLIVSAPDDLRAELRRLKRPAQIARCAQLRDRPAQGIEHRMTAQALRSTAQRLQTLQAEAKDLENEILSLVRQLAPEVLDLPWCRANHRSSAASQLVAPGPVPVRGGFRLLRWRLTDPGLLGADQPAPDQPQWRPAAEPGPAHHHADPDAPGPGHEHVRRPQGRRGQDLPRRPAMPQARHLPTALQDPRTLQPRRWSKS